VEDLPRPAILRSEDPPLRPDILGLFVGEGELDRSVMGPAAPLEAIFIYQRNLELFCATREDLVYEIHVTLVHELGHALGLEEEDLRERGIE